MTRTRSIVTSAPARHHLIEDGEKPIDASSSTTSINTGRSVEGFNETRRVDHTARTEPGDSVDDRCTREPFRPQPFQNRTRQRGVMPAVRFAQKNPHEQLIAVKYSHGKLLTDRGPAARKPAQPACYEAARDCEQCVGEQPQAARPPESAALFRN
jgi:hypothetical protein